MNRIAILLYLLLSFPAYAGQYGIGIETNETGALSAVVAQAWLKDIGIGFGYGQTKVNVKEPVELKTEVVKAHVCLKYAFLEDDLGKVYAGLKVARMWTEAGDTKLDTLTYGILMGYEYNFGLYWSLSYIWIKDLEPQVDISIKGTQGTLGFVKYF